MEEVKGYAFYTVLDTSFHDAVSRVTGALKEEGFGILTEIDMKAKLCHFRQPQWGAPRNYL
jgi:uncharacterized protein (DUF302 family)